MNKKVKRFGLLATVLLMVLAFAFPVMNAVAAQSYSANESYAILQYNLMLDYFGRRPEQEGGQLYPDYYGGAYIDLNSGNLVVKLTTGTPETVKETLCEVMENDDLIFEDAQFSFNYLLNVMNSANTAATSTNENCSMYIDDELNKVIIYTGSSESVYSLNPTLSISADPDSFICYDAATEFCEESSINCGSEIRFRSGITGTGSASLGFPMKKKNGSTYIHGFVTAYHSVTYMAGTLKAFYADSDLDYEIGRVANSSPNNATGVDATFVKFTNGYSATYNLEHDTNNSLYDRGYYSAPKNTTVYMDGGISDLVSGKIISTASSDNLAVNVYLFDYTSQGGDSGSPVYANAFGEMTLVAMHRGTAKMQDGTQYRAGVPIKAIIEYLDLTFDY